MFTRAVSVVLCLDYWWQFWEIPSLAFQISLSLYEPCQMGVENRYIHLLWRTLEVYYGFAGGIMSTKWSEGSKEFGIVSTTKETTLSLWYSGVNIFWILHFILDTTFQKRYWQTEWSSEDSKKKKKKRSRRWRDWFLRKDKKKKVCITWLSNDKGQRELTGYK